LHSLKEKAPELPTTTLFSDSAYTDIGLREQLIAQGASLRTPKKKPKGKELAQAARHYNRCVSRLRQSIESLFNWFNNKIPCKMLARHAPMTPSRYIALASCRWLLCF
jgi:hypothetical protein